MTAKSKALMKMKDNKKVVVKGKTLAKKFHKEISKDKSMKGNESYC